MTHAGRAASSPEIFRPFLTVCLTVFPFEFRPRTFTIGFYGKKSFISELMILECSFPLRSTDPLQSHSSICLIFRHLKMLLPPLSSSKQSKRPLMGDRPFLAKNNLIRNRFLNDPKPAGYAPFKTETVLTKNRPCFQNSQIGLRGVFPEI